MQLFPALSIDMKRDEPHNRQLLLETGGVKLAASAAPPPHGLSSPGGQCMTIDTGLSRVEFTGAAEGSGRPEGTGTKFFRSGLIWLPISLVVALAAWVLLSGYSITETKPVDLATTAATEPVQSQSKDGALNSFAAIPAGKEAGMPE